jgi:hypothetical protein
MTPRPSLLRIARERGVPLDPDDRERLALIDRHGWVVMHIFDPEELMPPFSFSVGLSHGFAHPEVIVVGLDREVSHVLVNQIGNRVRDGERLADGATRDDLLQGGYRVEFRAVHPAHHPAYLGTALWFNQWFNPGKPLPVLQCVWPDRQRRYPWDPQVDEAIRGRQPLLMEERRQGAARS